MNNRVSKWRWQPGMKGRSKPSSPKQQGGGNLIGPSRARGEPSTPNKIMSGALPCPVGQSAFGCAAKLARGILSQPSRSRAGLWQLRPNH